MTHTRALGPGRLWKRAGRWVLDYTEASGQRRRRVLGTDKRVAERRRAEIIRHRDMDLDGLGAVEGMTLTLDVVAEDYLEDLTARVTPMHLKNVRQKLDCVMRAWGDRRVRDLRQMDAVRFRNRLVTEGRSHRTANLYVDTVRAMLKWAVEAEVIAKNPLQQVRRLPERAEHQRYRRRAMTNEEIARFLAASEADDDENELRLDGIQRVPQTPLWLAMLETGARYGELRQASWGDVDFRELLLVLRAESTKSRKQRVIPLRQVLVDRLRGLRALHESVFGRLPTVQDCVFLTPEGADLPRPTTNPMRIFDRLLDRAGMAKIDPQGQKLDLHALRHTFASRLARSGVGLVHAQRLLGHSDPKLTAGIYTHLGVEELRAAVETLPADPGDAPSRRAEAQS